MLAAREKISPSSAFGPLIGRLAPILIVSWAEALPAAQKHMSEATIAAAIRESSIQGPPVCRVPSIRTRSSVFGTGLRSDERDRLSMGARLAAQGHRGGPGPCHAHVAQAFESAMLLDALAPWPRPGSNG